jgi:uncharacterized protein YdeI (BOF family)
MAETTSTKNSWTLSHKTLAIVIGSLLILFLVFMSGAAAGRFSSGFEGNNGRHEMVHGPMPRMNHSFGFGGVNNNQDRLRGTVTNVNGDTFTVAGYGSTNQIKTITSTSYHGGNQVKVNDTVVVFGNASNGILNATQVIINP